MSFKITNLIKSGLKVRMLGCAISGLLFGLSWPPIGLWVFAVTMPTILFLSISGQDVRSRFLMVVSFFTAAWAVAFHWNALHPVAATAFSSVVALFAMICIQSALVSLLSSSKLRGTLFSIPTLWGLLGIALFDWLMMFGPLAMPGTMTGLSLSNSVLADMWVPLAGSFSLTLVVLAINGVLVATLLKRRVHITSLVVCLAVFAIPFWGRAEPTDSTSNRLKVTAIQPGIPPSEWALVSDLNKEARMETMLVEALNENVHSGLYIFPETTLPIADSSSLSQIVVSWAKRFNINVMAGGIERATTGAFYNVVVGSDSTSSSFLYRKRRLVPFVEAVPFGDFLPFSEQFRLESGGVSAYAEGSVLAPYALGDIHLGTLICFESFFPSDARALRRQLADLLVVPTQDGWWQSQTARAQHAAYTRLLALAAGIPVIQAAVDGKTVMFDARGRVMAKSRGNARQFVHASIPLTAYETFYLRLGDSPSNVILGCLLLIYLMGLSAVILRPN